MNRIYNIFSLTSLKWSALAFFVVAVGIGFYCRHLSIQIDQRFSGRRWNIPSVIFSDLTILYPGQQIHMPLFLKKLDQLGYIETDHQPSRKGEMRRLGPKLEIYAHDLSVPAFSRPGLPVTITFGQDRIRSIVNVETGEDILIFELEPEEVMSFFGTEREQRQVISFDEIPLYLIRAVMAAEDTRFYQHYGMDIRAILRALVTNLKHGAIRQGGSTITQQLAKNYFLTSRRTFMRKLNELIISLVMEVMYQKNEIMEIYLNEIYLGQKGSVSVNGVGEASQFYFGKPVNMLSLEESAVIAGLIKSPNIYSPFVDKVRSLERRNIVLRTMYQKAWISEAAFQKAFDAPVNTVRFRPYSKKAPYFIDHLSRQLKEMYPPDVLTREGLTIYTTLDTQVQAAAERALTRGLERLEKNRPEYSNGELENRLQGAVVVIQPRTGHVLAMVGGRDYGDSQFNRITQARRQPGSAFKPFVFLTALDRFTTVSRLSNESRTYEVDDELWEPRNYTEIPDTLVSFRRALANSINIATVNLAVETGIDNIVRAAESFHFSTPIPPYLSISLGAAEVVPMDLARAYCSFAAEGVLPYPLLFKSVMDEKGVVLEQRHMDVTRVITPEKAYVMTSLLKSVVDEGTARSLKNLGVKIPVAGKTGTTNQFRDAWFVGYTPDILALVWVGFDDGAPIFSTGSSAAMPIWADLIQSIPQHLSGEWFRMPTGVLRRTVCNESGLLAADLQCPDITEEIFIADNVPTEPCPIHRKKGVFEKFLDKFKGLF